MIDAEGIALRSADDCIVGQPMIDAEGIALRSADDCIVGQRAMRRGAALAAVLLALALANALVVGAAFVARRQAAAARVDLLAAPLQPLAEEALVSAVVAWDSLARSAQPIGATVTLPASSPNVTVWITKTGAELYWLVAESRVASSPALSRRVGTVVRSVGGAPSVAFPRGWSELP